jgi:nucleotide-binding universal stress UspA family protein
MIKTILTHLTGTDCDQSVLAASHWIARLHSGHMACVRLVPDSARLIAQAAQVDMGTWMVLSDTVTAIEQGARERTNRARREWDEFCKREKVTIADVPPGPDAVSAAWIETIGDEFDEITALARFHDILVVAGGPERPGRLPDEALGSIIIGSGRPVLLAPQTARTGPLKTIAIAWKDSAEAARAIMAAMPLLAQAQRIEVLSANEEDKKAVQCLDCSEAVVRHLRWHGLNAHSHFVIPAGRTIPDAILESARGFGADLVVMGGYGHSRMREFVFGGFTRHILTGTDLPVLVSH